jgi:hypothetical protein
MTVYEYLCCLRSEDSPRLRSSDFLQGLPVLRLQAHPRVALPDAERWDGRESVRRRSCEFEDISRSPFRHPLCRLVSD